MIEWISSWLKGIIIIVLLASFIDLLLPNSSMQKYAKMVLGLLVIITIISPILGLFSDNSIVNLIQQLENPTYAKENDGIKQLEKNQFDNQQSYQERMIEQVEKTMKIHLEELLQGRFDLTVKNLKVDANVIDDKWQINEVVLYIGKNNAEYGRSDNSVKEINSVEVVNIDLSDNEKPASQKNFKANETAEEIKMLMQKEWGIAKNKIQVQIESDMD